MQRNDVSVVLKWIASLLLTCWAVTSDGVVFVDESAGGSDDGSSWDDAYPDLGLALSANQGAEIWVAHGTYLAASSFTLKDNHVFGGFKGAEAGGYESQREQRDPLLNPVILSGDLGGGLYAPVVVVKTTSGQGVLDGVTVRDGHAVSGVLNGGGIRVSSGSLVLAGCILTNNVAQDHGGALYFSGSSLQVTDCVFGGNTTVSTAGKGGAVHVAAPTTTAAFSDVTFFGNYSGYQGGGVYLSSDASLATVRITGCTFENTSARIGGGGVATSFMPDEQVYTDNRFVNVRAAANAVSSGGAILFYEGGDSPPFFLRNMFQGCQSGTESLSVGGAIYTLRGFPSRTRFVNCLFHGCRATRGAVLYTSYDPAGAVVFEHCTFADNEATQQASLFYMNTSETLITLKNCIEWDNTSPDDSLIYSYSSGFTVHNVISSLAPLTGYTGDASYHLADLSQADPLFEGPASGDYRPGKGSPAIDYCSSSSPDANPDLTGRNRRSPFDAGAYEYASRPDGLLLVVR